MPSGKLGEVEVCFATFDRGCERFDHHGVAAVFHGLERLLKTTMTVGWIIRCAGASHGGDDGRG